MEKKKCNKCEQEKPYTDFHKRTASSDGHDATCKICRNKHRLDGRINTLEDADEKFRVVAEEILTIMGYELYNKDNPVHKQFEERMATKYNKR